jgi:AcrR family transcriptional regulator
MVRITKEYDERLNELLAAAQQLFFEKGYEKTSVNHIIDKVGVAKGTFYHYFKSKEELLDKLVEQFSTKAHAEIIKIIENKELNAIEKFNSFASTMYAMKVENMSLMKMLMKVMYRDENLLLRHKIFMGNFNRLTPEYARLIKQGVEEGHFDTSDPEEMGEIILTWGYTLNEMIVGLLLETDEKPNNLAVIEKKLNAFERGMERLLGAKTGSLNMFNRQMIEAFKPGENEK